jgi:hypothetical protein
METKKGGFKKKLDTFHQTSWIFVGLEMLEDYIISMKSNAKDVCYKQSLLY